MKRPHAMVTPVQRPPQRSSSSTKAITPVAAAASSGPSLSTNTRKRRQTTTYGSSSGSNAPHQHQRSPLQVIRQAAAAQEALDARRQGVEGAIASRRVNGVVVAALQALLRSIHADRQTARQCLKALLFDPADHARTLERAQASQAELLDRAAHALAFAPLVQRVDNYLRDRNLPKVAFCLDQGAASWLRVRVARVDVTLPPGSAAAQAFSACTLEVTRQLPLVAVGPDMRSLRHLFQPLDVRLLRAALAGTDEREREVVLVLEIASASSSATTTTAGRAQQHEQQQRFVIEAYGYRTNFPAAAHAADAALLRKWAGRLAPAAAAAAGAGEGAGGGDVGSDLRVPAPRHVLGLRIPVPHPRLVPGCEPTPLAIKLSVR